MSPIGRVDGVERSTASRIRVRLDLGGKELPSRPSDLVSFDALAVLVDSHLAPAVALPTESDIGHHHFRPFVGCLVSADSSADDDGSPDHSIAPSKLYLPIHLPMSQSAHAHDMESGYPSGLALLAQLVEHLHGKEGVNGSSPLEGSAKAPQVGAFAFRSTCRFSRVRWVWSRLWSFRVGEGLGRAGPMPSEPPRQRRGRGMDV